MGDDELKFIEFRLGSLFFGIDIFKIKNVINIPSIMPLPQAPSFLVGVINLREELIPVVKLSEKFGLDSAELTSRSKIIIVSMEDREIGIIVDEVKDVLAINQEEMKSPYLEHQLGIKLEYIDKIAQLKDKLIIILNVDKIFSLEEKKIIEQV